MNSNTTMETTLKYYQLVYSWELTGEKLYALMPPRTVIPTIYLVQLERVIQNLSLTLAEMINDTT